MIQDTSRQAYWREVHEKLGDKHLEVLRTLETLGSATNTEIAKYLNWSINRVTPRVNELVHMKDPLVMDAGKRICRETGRLVHAWTLTMRPVNVKKDFVFHSKRHLGLTHRVTDYGTRIACTCPGYKYRGTCSHVEEVQQSKSQVTLFNNA